MVERVIEACVANRMLVGLGVVLLALWGWASLRATPLDAIPDLSENQVIVLTEWPGRAPQVVEDQITYPLSGALQGIPGVKAVRANSMFGLSMIYVIFEDDIDLYWARTRVLERLGYATSLLPEGVSPQLGPDGTGVGHVFWYVLRSEEHDLAELRALQDFYVRWLLQSVEGVAEVASIGGFEQEYQVELDPDRLLAHGVTLQQVLRALREGNRDVGGRVLEMADAEYFVSAAGYLRDIEDIEGTPVGVGRGGTPVRLADVAHVQLGGDIRRGLLDLNGEGEVVGGIIVMRQGENALAVIERVRERLAEVEAGLPVGVSIEVAYDRRALIERAVDTLREALTEEAAVVAVIVVVFLGSLGASLVVLITLPLGVLVAFIFMRAAGVGSNIMSLGGIAIAMAEMVDAAIVMVENAHRRLAEAQRAGPVSRAERVRVVLESSKQVGPALFFSMLIIVTSFVPVFLLSGQEGKLFHPLAWTKTFAMLGGSLLSITVVPVLMVYLLRGLPGRRLHDADRGLLSRVSVWAYRPFLAAALRYRGGVVALTALAGVSVIPLLTGLERDRDGDGRVTGPDEVLVERIGSEFMPALDEGTLLYMPVTLPNVSITEAKRLLQVTDHLLAQVPEVARVLGKVGRAETATDPAPVAMIETLIELRPESEWREGLTRSELLSELDARLQIPGLTNGWTQPIVNRINMLATGIRTDLGVKIFGPDLDVLAQLALDAEALLRPLEGTADLYAERLSGGRYLVITLDREAIGRYGASVEDVQRVVETAIGGAPLTETVEGRARFGVRVRYDRDLRDSPDDLAGILVAGMGGRQIPLGHLVDIEVEDGPPSISSEDGLLRSAVLLNVRDRDLRSYIEEADAVLTAGLALPPGYSYRWAGQWENQLRARERLQVLVPVALAIVFVFLYLTFRRMAEALLVMLAVPFALVGGVWLLYLMDLRLSVAVWVGFIALFGVAVETGVVMVVYLQEALEERIREARTRGVALTRADVLRACYEGSLLRLRPKLMTVATTMIGLTPLLWATGTGADVMRPIAIPMIGGMISSTAVVLLLTPALFASLKLHQLARGGLAEDADGAAADAG